MRVAVFGAGYAGLTVARRLSRRLPDETHLLVVDGSPDHLVKHELHRVVRRPGLADALTVPLETALPDATIVEGRVTDVDPERGRALLTDDSGDERALVYDMAAVCLGPEPAFHGLSGVREHATPLNRLEDARAIREAALAAAGGDVVVGGGGLTGIQAAGELAELSSETGQDLSVTLLERNERVASGFDRVFSRAVARELDARGVTVRTGTSVERADAQAVHTDDGSLSQDVFVWAGGVRGPAAFDGERRAVDGDLHVGGGTFVVGDAGVVTDADGQRAPASAQTAVQQARVAATNLVRLAETSGGRDARFLADEVPFECYRYESPGWVVSVGDGAVARVGPVVLSGDPARAAKAVIGAGHLGSVGEVEAAADVVAEELGWPTSDAVASVTRLNDLLELDDLSVLTDPASPSQVQYPFALTAVALAEAFGSPDVDLTPVTRLADREFPGSPAGVFDRTVLRPAESMVEFATLGMLGRRPDAPHRDHDDDTDEDDAR